MTRVRGNAFRENRETVIDDQEMGKALEKASTIKDGYFRIRALAVLSLLRLCGKRQGEISWIPLDHFKVENDLLTVTFALEKKKRKHKKCPSCDTKNSKGSLFCKKCGASLQYFNGVHFQAIQSSEGPSTFRPSYSKYSKLLELSPVS